jgi:two-component system chemotaxis sensor kinase CheA
VRVRADNLDRLLRSTGQLLTQGLNQEVVARELTGLSRRLAELAKESEAVRGRAAAPASVARYLRLVEQELHALSRQARAVRHLHRRGAGTLRRLGGALQEDVRRVRTVPAEDVFHGFRKMMRDLARAEGKAIDFGATGLEIEADRAVLQALKDPLLHLLTNAVTHGIESPDQRRRQGKPEAGLVRLHLEAVGNRLQVRVEDDGRGLDAQELAAAAVRRGFLSEAEADAASPEEVARVVFRPGFSTAAAVTGLAGRGMGLSVVSEAVARLQGEVSLQEGNPGVAFVLAVPLSLSTQRLLLVSCRGQTFAVPVHSVGGLLRVKVAEVETVEGRPLLLLQGRPVPLHSLAGLLGMGEAGVRVTDDSLSVMVLRGGAKRVAVAVDGFVGERDSLVKGLDAPAANVHTLAGGIQLEDGTVALVLNPAALRPGDKAPPLKAAAPEPTKKAPTVLVVDDSLTTRTLERSILEAHGYAVRIATDGVEALEHLRDEAVDLVITDVQMPRMDGFQLLEAIKKDERLTRLPVIVVTSMGRREDQERGLALGADAYVVKQKFDHEELLRTIRQIV